MSKKIFNVKRLISVSLAVVIVFSSNAFVTNNSINAARTGTGNADRYVLSSTAGDLKMDYPSEYPSDLLEIESEDVIKNKVEALLAELTQEEKLDMLSADGGNTVVDKTYGTGTWLGVGRVGIPVIRMYDGPMGVRGNSGYETTRPTNETSMASSFDKQMQYDYGVMYADEEYANAGNVQLGNQNDLIRRISRDRSRDMFSEDWYLSGVASYQMAKGLEDNNTISCLKHYVGVGNVDEQTLHENYLTPVEMSVKNGGASAVMTNYGTLNGVSACIDSYLLKDVLRNMWNFKGIVMTDWGGNYAFTTTAGVTMETPGGTYNNAEALQKALDDGTLKQTDIDEMVSYNLYALGHAGYLGLVVVDRYGVAVDDSKDFMEEGRAISRDDIIELPLITGDEREEMLEKNNEKAIEFAEKGAVLLKNENYNEKSALPLASTENVAMIGFGSTYLLAGHMHECSFGSLRGLSVSPSDALKELWPSSNVKNYVTQDIVGEPVPANNLYQDATGEEKGVIRTGINADGSTVADGAVDGNINFVTNSTNYKNASNGTAFPAAADGTGVNYKWETYLEAPETGTYTIGVEGISWQTLSSTMERSNKDTGEVTSAALGSAIGNSGIGTFGSTSIVCTDSGLDVPTSNTQLYLEKGKRYKVTVNANATALSAEYQRGIKDSQIRLAWITPSQKESNYNDAVAAVGTANTSVVLFAHSAPETMGMAFDAIPNQEKTQPEMIDEMIAAAKAANNKIILVLSTGLPSYISKWADDPAVEAILQMWLPGQGGGTAIANLISGKTSPSGKLTLAWPRNTEGVLSTGMFGGSSTTYVAIDDQAKDNGGKDKTGRITNPDNPASAPSFFANSTEIREGIFNGYKWYDAKNLDDKVLYDFGHGLSYTDFDYELVSVKANADGADDYGYDFTVKVTNTGTAKGSDAPQVYIGAADEDLIDGDVYYSPDEVNNSWRYVGGNESDNYATAEYFPVIDGIQQAKYQLVGFERTKVLEPNESDTVTLHIDQRALSYWDVTIPDDELLVRSDGTKHKYRVIEGGRNFFLGKSSDEFVTVNGTTDIPVDVSVVKTVSLNKASITLEQGGADVLLASINPQNSEETLTWTSSDENITTVKDGSVTAVGVGTATVTVTLSNGNSASCVVTVTKKATNKETLKTFIDYAEEQTQLDDYKLVTQSVREALETALVEARKVYNNPDATQEQIDEIKNELLKWCQSLNMTEGNKTLLLDAITQAGGLNLINYIAKGQARFKIALANAKEAFNNIPITQEEINEATDELNGSMLALRFKADKTILENLLKQATLINTKLYTVKSVNALLEAIDTAQLIVDGEVTKENQFIVDNTASALQASINGLVRTTTPTVQLSKATGLKLTAKQVTWKKVSNNNGYTLKIVQGTKVIKTIQINKDKTSYSVPNGILKKGNKYKITLVVKGTGNYTNSIAATSSTVTIKQLATPNGFKLTAQKATWKKVANNNGYTLKIVQGTKVIKTVQIKKGNTSYTIPKKILKNGKTYRVTLVANGTGKYLNSKSTKSITIKK